MKIPVTNIQKFCMHDGPGIRTVVFLKGCPLKCKWCHNPETQSAANQIFYDAKKCIGCGACRICAQKCHIFERSHIFNKNACKGCGLCAQVCLTGALEQTLFYMDIDDVMKKILDDRAFYGETGGVTVSGGEPMAHPEETIEILKRSKAAGISTAIETCGFFDEKYIARLTGYTDLFLYDIKDTVDSRHIENTGVSNKKIMRNLELIDALDKKIVLRCIIIRGINDNEEHFQNLKLIKSKLKSCVGIDFLPYHPMAKDKCEKLGICDSFNSKDKIPAKSTMERLKFMS